MAMLARTPAQVIAGEATYRGTLADTYRDMQAIASVISNRAALLGVSQQQVVGVNSQFNAYNKSLPAGAASYVDLAQQALDDVALNGPINNATFYATPTATKNLPSGLQSEDETAGHQFFSDPHMRAIKTSVGFRAPNQYTYAQMVANPPVPEARPDLALAYDEPAAAVQTPFDAVLAPTPQLNSFASLAAANPIAAPMDVTASGVLGMSPAMAANAATAIGVNPSAESFAGGALPAAATVSMPSAQGFDAARFGDVPSTASFDSGRFAGPLGDPNASLAEFGQAPSEKTSRLGGNVQQTADPSRMNVDDSARAAVEREISRAIENAVSNPRPAVNSFADLAAAGPISAPVADQAVTPENTGINSDFAKQIAAQAEQNLADMQSQARPSTTAEDAQAQAATDTSGWSTMANPGVMSQAAAYQQMAAAAAPAGITNLAGQTLIGPAGTATVNLPDPNVSLESTTLADTQTTTPSAVTSYVEQPSVRTAVTTSSVDRAPTSQPQHSAMDVWSGLATTGIATDGTTVSRLPDGTVGRYNAKYDHTEYTNPDGTWGGVKKGNTLTDQPAADTAANPSSSTSSASGLSDPNASLSGLSNSLMSGGTVGGLAGAALGTALAGPIGGIALGMIGQKLGGKVLGDGIPDKSPLRSLVDLFSAPAANSFPAAPTAPAGANSSSGLNSYGQSVYGGSGQFSSAVDSGKSGLW